MGYSSSLRKISMKYINFFPFYKGFIYLKLRPIVKYLKNKVVLEIGCGEGDLSEFVSRYAKKVYAMDLNPLVLEVVKKRENIEYVVGDATKMEFPDNSFDFIIASEVLEHIEEDRKVLKEMKRVLKKGGKIFITVPNSEFLKEYDSKVGNLVKSLTPRNLNKDIFNKRDFNHVRLGYSKDDFEKISEEFNFKILELYYRFKLYEILDFRFSLPTVVRFVLRPILDPILCLMLILDKKIPGQGGSIQVIFEKL
jgi:ubiquinone/menaquinone biosynthesis C-methylase UbiE